jgi:hypothetical protein
MKESESRIQMKIVSYLRRSGYYVFSVPNEAVGKIRTRAGLGRSANLKLMGLTSGVSDLVVLMNNKIFFLEIKTPDGKQSKNQKDFEAEVEKLGFTYYLCRSLDEVIEKFPKLSIESLSMMTDN